QPFRTYNVLPNALLVNFKAINFQFLVDPRDGRVKVTTDPLLSNLDVRNGIGTAGGACRGYQAGISIDVVGAELAEVQLGGAFAQRCGSYGMSRSALKHDTYAFGLL